MIISSPPEIEIDEAEIAENEIDDTGIDEPGDLTPAPLAFLVEAADVGTRLDRLIAERIGDISRSRVKSLMQDGFVTLDGAVMTDPSHKPRAGQSVMLARPAPVGDTPLPQDIALDIVYEDSDLVVLNKPAGLVVHPAPGNWDSTLVNALLAHCGDSLVGIGGVRRPGIVHRIDKDTSGLMVVAKTEIAHAALSAGFAAHTIERAYWALVWGMPNPREGEIEGAIGRSPMNRKKMAITANGKPAVTGYRVLRPVGLHAALVECRLRTGRTHQIRVHMTSLGHPLIGDPLYGRTPSHAKRDPAATSVAQSFPRQALHAWLLGFPHPTNGNLLHFESSMPDDLTEVIRSLE